MTNKPKPVAQPKHQPDFNVFIVSKKDETDKEGFWTKIGAAWKHQDGDGLNITLTALPIDGQLVLRIPKADTST